MPDDVITTGFSKNGITPIEFDFDRSGAGVKVTVRTIPDVEEFMRNLGSGKAVEIETYGRYWRPITKAKTLLAYDLSEQIEPTGKYRIDLLGWPANHDGYTNLSFLRLVGSSDERGASFYLKMVVSRQGLIALADQLAAMAQQFYIDYMKPMDVIVKVSIQELKL
jgi:hypothetical protein